MEQPLSDEQLVVIVRSQDNKQYAELIRRYQSKLTHYLRKFINDNDELEDVLQTVFIKAYRNLNGFNIERKFSPWIYRIAHNEAINSIKKHSGRLVSISEQEFEIIDEQVDIEKGFDVNLAGKHISEALATIKMKYREPLILYYFEQKTYDEISEILHVPIGTVGTLISRGKQALKKQLETYGK